MVKSSFIKRANKRTVLGGRPEDANGEELVTVTAIFQAQNFCMRLFVRGQTAVAHWSLPNARSMAFAVMFVFCIRSSSISVTVVCLFAVICT
jgi:hypothetical protein